MATYGLTLVTAATSEPVTLAEAKVQCGVAEGMTYHDDKIRSLIAAAREKVEADTSRALVTQTWDYVFDVFPCGLEAIYLPKTPIASVTHIKYFDQTNTEQTLATSVYKTFLNRVPAEIRLKYGQQWPFLYGEAGVITVRFVAGQGVTAIPGALKQAVLLSLHSLYDPAAAGDIEDAYMSLIQTHMVGDEFHAYGRTIWQ